MQNFDKKVKYLNSLFIYKFKIYDYDSLKFKIYYISPDNQHIYLKIDSVPDSNKLYTCEIGELYFDELRRMTFEDTPTETFDINATEFKIFVKCYDKTPSWTALKISEIIEVDGKKDLSL